MLGTLRALSYYRQMNIKPDCPFCLDNHLLKGDIIATVNGAYLINAQPPNASCYLIIPELHTESPQDLPDTWWQSVKALLLQMPEMPTDYNLSFNIGKVSGQTLSHLHLWVIPRVAGQPASDMGLASLIARVNQTT
jgi:diadenosine tetraphosphate (Ap4A) HIT family hydrolase